MHGGTLLHKEGILLQVNATEQECRATVHSLQFTRAILQFYTRILINQVIYKLFLKSRIQRLYIMLAFATKERKVSDNNRASYKLRNHKEMCWYYMLLIEQ